MNLEWPIPFIKLTLKSARTTPTQQMFNVKFLGNFIFSIKTKQRSIIYDWFRPKVFLGVLSKSDHQIINLIKNVEHL